MNAEDFSEFILNDRHRELIIAVLDNNVSPINMDDQGPIERFSNIIERWQEEIYRTNSRKGFPVKVIWVAVMTRFAYLNPNSTWNRNTYEPIYVLRVGRKTNQNGTQEYCVDESSAVRVAAALNQWMGLSRE